GVDWPIRYDDLVPWYDHVECFAGISGSKEGLDILPDGIFQTPMELNYVEQEVMKGIESNFKNRHLIIGRSAHLTDPTQEQTALERSTCQHRNHCKRGCPFGAYFSTQAAILPAARQTENVILVNNKILYQVIFDKETDKAIGVKAIDEKTR
ncbi:MAG: choline dehydrogenase-like flavoprotein, partial [Arcticibacterium sp.]